MLGRTLPPPPSQAPWLTHKTSLEVPDFVCREVKCPAWSMLPVLESLAAELGADGGTGANHRDRDNGSAGDDGRARSVTGTRLMAMTAENLFPGSMCPSGGIRDPASASNCSFAKGHNASAAPGHWRDGGECVYFFDEDK